jgi:imidazolonepropionase
VIITRIHNIGALLSCEGPERGPISDWQQLGLRSGVDVLISQPDPSDGADDGAEAGPATGWPTIEWIGATADQGRPAYDREIDLEGCLLTPGLVDCHTHAVFAGDRAGELMARLAGASYQKLADAGGGILHTVAATRGASASQLAEGLTARLQEMAAWGARVVEVKTGYGLDLSSELRCLDAIALAAARHPATLLVATAMPAHAVPYEFSGDIDGYVHAVCDEILPALLSHPIAPAFIDCFVERGYFSVEHAERIWEAAADFAAANGLNVGLKAHVDEFSRVGGLRWAIDAGATSVEHLLASDDDDLDALCASDTVAVGLPLVSVFLGEPYARLRRIVDHGGLLAIATDCNPGSSMSTNLMLAAQLGVFGARLTPAEAFRAVTVGGALALARPSGYDGRLRVGGPFCATAFDVERADALFYELGAPPRASLQWLSELEAPPW